MSMDSIINFTSFSVTFHFKQWSLLYQGTFLINVIQKSNRYLSFILQKWHILYWNLLFFCAVRFGKCFCKKVLQFRLALKYVSVYISYKYLSKIILKLRERHFKKYLAYAFKLNHPFCVCPRTQCQLCYTL